jgi:hypothetical protein
VVIDKMRIGAGPHGEAAGVACANAGSISAAHIDAEIGAGQGGAAAGVTIGNDGAIALSDVFGQLSVAGDDQGIEGDEGAGGIAYQNRGTIGGSYVGARVDGGTAYSSESHDSRAYVGGIAAFNSGTVADTYVTGQVLVYTTRGGPSYCGGLIGIADTKSVVRTSYAAGAITCPDAQAGGAFGDDSGKSNASLYWDLDTTGISNPAQGAGNNGNDPGVTGLSDAQLKSGLPAGFDPAIWGQSASIDDGYPYLLGNPPPQ